LNFGLIYVTHSLTHSNTNVKSVVYVYMLSEVKYVFLKINMCCFLLIEVEMNYLPV
jgi:hypothetical protein